MWTDVDAARTGNLPFVFEPDMSFERYVEYAMDVPMYFVYRDGKYINALGQSWRDFMEVRETVRRRSGPSYAHAAFVIYYHYYIIASHPIVNQTAAFVIIAAAAAAVGQAACAAW